MDLSGYGRNEHAFGERSRPASDDRRLVVCDFGNHRVLFGTWPLGEPAGATTTAVIGQVNFDASGENGWQAVTPDTLCWPYGLHLHAAANRLLLAVADSGNNQVMVWQHAPED